MASFKNLATELDLHSRFGSVALVMIFIAQCTNRFLIVHVELLVLKWQFQLNTAFFNLGYS